MWCGNDNKVAVRPITMAQQDETQAVIDKGVEAGERVVTTGFARLTPGAEVAVTNAEQAPPAGVEPAPPQSDAAARTARAALRGERRRGQLENRAR